MEYRIAVVEDNATARTTLRSHLLPIGDIGVSSFTSGTELKGALRKQNFELIFMDYHLGQGRSGVEWVQTLRESGFIRPSTGIIFLTSDRSPQVIGSIMDLQPDALLIKPYTIASLTRQVEHYFTYRKYVESALKSLDSNQRTSAINFIRKRLREGVPPRLVSDLRKLFARLLFENGEYERALILYEDVLTHSDRVLWAQWGKIKCQYASGEWTVCKHDLNGMVGSSLAKDKAFEWLAALSFEQESYAQTEKYLENIKFSELSLPAARLKTIAFQKQDKVIEAIDLLQKKRAMHRSAKDRFNDFTLELAEFYLLLAEESPATNRKESLSQARKLVGIAGRGQNDAQALQRRDFLLAFSAVLDDDDEKAAHFIDSEHMDNFVRTSPSTLVIAAKVFHKLGDEEKAAEALQLAREKNSAFLEVTEQASNSELIIEGGTKLDLNDTLAISLNDSGMQLFQQKKYNQALKYFYDAFTLSISTAAFGLNLLQCMLESNTAVYRKYTVQRLLTTLSDMKLNIPNQRRLDQLSSVANANN